MAESFPSGKERSARSILPLSWLGMGQDAPVQPNKELLVAETEHPDRVRRADDGIRLLEDLVYLVVALLLAVGAGALLVTAAVTVVTDLLHDPEEAVKRLLDLLLLVFIMVELLGAVRTTLTERKLVAEPFLIVGMIASIKEVVVVSISAKDTFGTPEFTDAITEIGVLAGLLVALALAMFLTRKKEREPEE